MNESRREKVPRNLNEPKVPNISEGRSESRHLAVDELKVLKLSGGRVPGSMNESDEQVLCPNRNCFEGVVFSPCRSCGGEGHDLFGGTCLRCSGSGEDPETSTCAVCQGAGKVELAFARIYETAARCEATALYLHEHDGYPKWNGDDSERPGVTDYSLAMYYRNREQLRKTIARVVGRPSVEGETEGNTGTHEVDLVGNERLTFRGFSWGYGGTGPSGLALVLADLGFFTSVDEARKYVGSLSQKDPWVLTARQLPA